MKRPRHLQQTAISETATHTSQLRLLNGGGLYKAAYHGVKKGFVSKRVHTSGNKIDLTKGCQAIILGKRAIIT